MVLADMILQVLLVMSFKLEETRRKKMEALLEGFFLFVAKWKTNDLEHILHV